MTTIITADFNLDCSVFDGFQYPKEWSQEEALEAFSDKISPFESYEFVDMNPKSFQRNYQLVPKKL